MKQCRRLKARACTDGRKQCLLYAKKDISSPATCTESVMLTALIDTFEGQDVAIVNIPGAFLNAGYDPKDIVHMILEGVTADIMVQIAPDIYGPYLRKGKKVSLFSKSS